MPTPEYQRAVLAARDVLSRGGRILVSSRSFWNRYPVSGGAQGRRNVVQAARELLQLSNQIEAGGITGTIAQAMSDAGLPTTDLSGGLTGGTSATVYARVSYGTLETGMAFRTIKVELPWDTSLDQLESAIDEAIADIGEDYGLDGGSIISGTLAIY